MQGQVCYCMSNPAQKFQVSLLNEIFMIKYNSSTLFQQKVLHNYFVSPLVWKICNTGHSDIFAFILTMPDFSFLQTLATI